MKLIADQFSKRFSPEQQMLLNRVILASVSGFIAHLFVLDAGIVSSFCAYLVFNILIFVMEQRSIWKPESRWLVAILCDAVLAFQVMYVAPEQMSVFYPVLLWIVLSNGFRFGINWLLAASVLSTVSFGAVVLSTSYWQQNMMLGLVLTFALLAIPAYCSTLIRNISDAKKQADLASTAKSYFLASVSHELRTPLNAIIGYGNHLRQSKMPRGQKDMVEASVMAGEHLLHLIEQLIDVAKAGTGKTEVKRTAFRATDLLTETRDIMTGRVEEKGLALYLQATPLSDNMVEGPVSVIRNILLNLVGNAVKFTETGSITISCGLKMPNNKSTLWFAVSDTGIGIQESAKELIFQPFVQADDTVMNRFGGTGLGLSICKQLTEQVDGEITVESQIGLGSIFRIEIPVEDIQRSSEFDDHPVGAQINILSFGQIQSELLANAQAQESFNVRHVGCDSRAALLGTLRDIALDQYQVALIPAYLAQAMVSDDIIWAIFAEADIAPVLVAENVDSSARGLIDLPAMTSILTPASTFEEIRSALKIGNAFARKMRISHDVRESETPVYTPKRVLVADDNRTNRNVLAAILEAAGHTVSMATDGDEALVELEKGETDILLLDVNMPRLGGIDACIAWRERENGTGHLPIIGVTADATMETEAKCIEAGMDLRITKPVNATLLLSTIEKYCAHITETKQPQTHQPSVTSERVVLMKRDSHAPMEAIDRAQIQYLRSIGDQAFVETMMEGFLEDIEQTIGPMRNAVKGNDVAAFRFCAHAFKSSGNNMGAIALSHLCARLERVSDSDFAEHKLEYLADVEQKIASAVAALSNEKYVGEPSPLAGAG